jgi:hypothetical protein
VKKAVGKFDSKKATRENAREQIGSPRPSQVRSHRPRNSSKPVLDPTLNSAQPKMFRLSDPAGHYVEGAPRRASSESLHLHPAIAVIPRPEKHKASVCLQFSPEVIQNVNLLRASGGDEAATEYLKSIKEQNQMSHAAMAEILTRAAEPKPVVEVGGTIETALLDAERKEKHYRSEQLRMGQEAQRWEQVANGLREVIKLTTGPLARSSGHNGNGSGSDEHKPKGYWDATIGSILTQPMTKSEIFKGLAARGENKQRMYPALYNMVKRGILIEIDGKICKPSWTDPAKAS